MALCHDVTTLQQKAPDLVGQGGAIGDRAVARSVQRLDVELLLALELDHVLGG